MDKTILQYDGDFMPGEIFDIEVSNVATEMASVEDSSLVFDEDANVKTTPVPAGKACRMSISVKTTSFRLISSR